MAHQVRRKSGYLADDLALQDRLEQRSHTDSITFLGRLVVTIPASLLARSFSDRVPVEPASPNLHLVHKDSHSCLKILVLLIHICRECLEGRNCVPVLEIGPGREMGAVPAQKGAGFGVLDESGFGDSLILGF